MKTPKSQIPNRRGINWPFAIVLVVVLVLVVGRFLDAGVGGGGSGGGASITNETDPVWTADKPNYATGTPVYAETDPLSYHTTDSKVVTNTGSYAALTLTQLNILGWVDMHSRDASNIVFLVGPTGQKIGFEAGGYVTIYGTNGTGYYQLTPSGQTILKWPNGSIMFWSYGGTTNAFANVDGDWVFQFGDLTHPVVIPGNTHCPIDVTNFYFGSAQFGIGTSGNGGSKMTINGDLTINNVGGGSGQARFVGGTNSGTFYNSGTINNAGAIVNNAGENWRTQTNSSAPSGTAGQWLLYMINNALTLIDGSGNTSTVGGTNTTPSLDQVSAVGGNASTRGVSFSTVTTAVLQVTGGAPTLPIGSSTTTNIFQPGRSLTNNDGTIITELNVSMGKSNDLYTIAAPKVINKRSSVVSGTRYQNRTTRARWVEVTIRFVGSGGTPAGISFYVWDWTWPGNSGQGTQRGRVNTWRNWTSTQTNIATIGRFVGPQSEWMVSNYTGSAVILDAIESTPGP